MQCRRLLTVLAVLLGAVPVLSAPAAADVHLSGWTNACFGSPCTPSTQSSLQFSPYLGLLYINGTFAGSTAADMLALGGSPSLPNTDNLGSFMLGALAASYEGVPLDLRVRLGGVSVAVPAVLHGAVTDAGTGGVVVDFDDSAHPATLGDGTAVAVSVQDLSLAPGATVALSGTVTTGVAPPPAGATVATPVAGAPAVGVTGVAGGVPFAGTTAGGVLPLTLATVDVPGDPAVHTGEPFAVALDLTAPVVAHAVFTGTVVGTVVAAGTGAYVIDFPDAPVPVELPDGLLALSVNDLAVAPGHIATLTGQVVQVPSNRPPVAAPDSYSRHRGNHAPVVTIGVLANDSDPEGDALTAELVTPTTHGTVVLAPDGTFSYDPSPNYQYDDAFTYRAFDGKAWSAPATVTITVERGGR